MYFKYKIRKLQSEVLLLLFFLGYFLHLIKTIVIALESVYTSFIVCSIVVKNCSDQSGHQASLVVATGLIVELDMGLAFIRKIYFQAFMYR